MGFLAENLFYRNLPPTVTGQFIVQSNSVVDAAESFDWVGGLGADAPKGQVFLAVEAKDQDIWVRFGPTSTTGTTSSNGRLIKAGEPAQKFYVSPSRHRYIDHIAAAATGVLKVQVCSHIGERENQ